jgi:hypothetical protein
MLHLNSRGFVFDGEHVGKDPVEELKLLLSAETVAVNSYQQCLTLDSAGSLSQLATTVRDLHAANAALLNQYLVDHNIEIPEHNDLWQSLTGLLKPTAALFGEDALLGVFRKNELDLFTEYESKISAFEGEDLGFVQQKLIPNQLEICRLVGAVGDGLAEKMGQSNAPLNLDLA